MDHATERLTGDLLGRPAEHLLDRGCAEENVTLEIEQGDHVGGVVEHLAVELLAPAELLLCALLLRHVDDDRDDSAHLAVRVAHRSGGELDGDDASVLGQPVPLRAVRHTGHDAVDHREMTAPLRCGDDRVRAADRLLRRPAEHVLRTLVPAANDAAGIEVEDRDRRRVDQRAPCLVRLVERLELPRELERRRDLVGEHPEHLKALAAREQPVDRIVDPDEPDELPLPAEERNDEPVVVPRVRPAAVEHRAVRRRPAHARVALLAGEQVAPFDLELRIEERIDVANVEIEPERLVVAPPARSRACDERTVRIGKLNRDLVEAERAADVVADELQHRVDRDAAGQMGGDLDEPLERGAPLRALRGRLHGLDRGGRVMCDGDEDVELVVGRAPAGDGLRHRDHAEHPAVGGLHRHEQLVLRPPRVRGTVIVDVGHVPPALHGRPVVLAGRDEERAPPLEARIERAGPALGRLCVAEQDRARLLAPEDADDLEVVPRRAIEVDDDDAVAQRLGDRPGHLREQRRQVRLVAHELRHFEQPAESRERRGLGGERYRLCGGRHAFPSGNPAGGDLSSPES